MLVAVEVVCVVVVVGEIVDVVKGNVVVGFIVVVEGFADESGFSQKIHHGFLVVVVVSIVVVDEGVIFDGLGISVTTSLSIKTKSLSPSPLESMSWSVLFLAGRVVG